MPTPVPGPRAPTAGEPSCPSQGLALRALSELDDTVLVERARAGDTSSFRLLFERHQGKVYGLVLQLVRDEQDALELVQEAFLRAYRGLERFDGRSAFYTWLYRIANNLCIDWLRRPCRKEQALGERVEALAEHTGWLLSARPDVGPERAFGQGEVAHLVRAVLDGLPPYHRSVIEMRELQGMSYEEMASALGISKGTVMSRLFHARQKVQKALAGYYAEQAA
jgi:RNA polymerase sigma-70 factor (ECF subfamily)